MTREEIEQKIRNICTYHSELGEGTSGYSLSEDQFQELFSLIPEVLEGLLPEKTTLEKFSSYGGINIQSAASAGFNHCLDKVNENIKAWKGK